MHELAKISAVDRERLLAIVLALLATFLVAMLTARRRPGWVATTGAVLMLMGDAVWLHQHNGYEGLVILAVGSHGIPVADLGVPPSMAIAAAVLFRRVRG